MTTAIILAAGKGTRLNSQDINKTALPFAGKPMIVHGVETLQNVADHIVVVVGHQAESVKSALKTIPHITFAYQQKPQGTGDAARIGVKAIDHMDKKPDLVLIGYGDHLMHYTEKRLKSMIHYHRVNRSKVTFVTTDCPDPNHTAWGRIIRDENNQIIDIVEQKDATPDQRKIKESNAGFYCFDYPFLTAHIDSIRPSKVTGEYYLPDMAIIAIKLGYKANAFNIPFHEVGSGINTKEQFQENLSQFKRSHLN